MADSKKGEFRTLEGVKRSGEMYDIDPKIIKIEDGFNARDFTLPENREHVDQLARSIAEIGLQKPIEVRYHGGDVYLTDGESRLRAVLKAIEDGAPIQTIKAMRQDGKISDAERVLGLITHNQGKPLTPLEQCEVFSRLHKFGWTDAKIAKAVGLTAAHISGIMKLHTSPEAVKQLIRDGKVAASMAINVVRDHGPEKAVSVLNDAAKNAEAQGKTRATAQHVTATPSKAKRKTKNSKPTWTQKEVIKTLISFVVGVQRDTSMPRSLRTKARDVLENADVDAKTWDGDK